MLSTYSVAGTVPEHTVMNDAERVFKELTFYRWKADHEQTNKRLGYRQVHIMRYNKVMGKSVMVGHSGIMALMGWRRLSREDKL